MFKHEEPICVLGIESSLKRALVYSPPILWRAIEFEGYFLKFTTDS